MTDTPDAQFAPDPEQEEYGETEVWVSDGEVWFPNAAKMCEELGIDGIVNNEGVISAFVRGKGAVLLSDALKAKRGTNITAITGGKPK
jgi:hypothetical protein